MRSLAVAIVATWFFSAACDGDRRTSAASDAGDAARAADVGGDAGEDERQGDGAGTTDAEPPACPMQSPQGQPCEPVVEGDHGIGDVDDAPPDQELEYLGAGNLEDVGNGGVRQVRQGVERRHAAVGRGYENSIHENAMDVLFLDGVYGFSPGRTPIFHPTPAPTDQDIARVAAAVFRRVERRLADREHPTANYANARSRGGSPRSPPPSLDSRNCL